MGASLIAASPEILALKWGSVTVKNPDGSIKQYKDCKLFPTGSSIWDWRLTGTEHNPGIQITDIAAFINNVDIVILTEGMDGVLQIMPETIEYIKNVGKEYHKARNKKAAKLYATLTKEGKKVGMVLHSTC